MKRQTIYPKVYLAIDNCFASKRWTAPADWISVIKGIGINYIEASADNECDPLYMSESYLKKWVYNVGDDCIKSGVKICNLYSGHGTYATLGLTHTDISVRDKMQYEWLHPMIDMSSGLDAGFGFYCHAFNQHVINNRDLYLETVDDLYKRLAELASYAATTNSKSIGIEQMYTPHQIPWTVEGAKQLLQKVKTLGGKPFYITIDLGHQSGQKKFLRPDERLLKDHIRKGVSHNLWLGIKSNDDLYKRLMSEPFEEQEKTVSEIIKKVKEYRFLFAEPEDGNPYFWLKQLGRYSPIIHLQQTDGNHSSHKPFTKEFNEGGIIRGEKVLKAIAESYDKEDDSSMPVPVKNIYLTIEVFSSTADYPQSIIKGLEETAKYWRHFIPEDGLTLDKLISNIEG